MDFYYVSSNGTKIDFMDGPVICEYPEDILKYKKKYNVSSDYSKYAKLVALGTTPSERSITLSIVADDYNEFVEVFNLMNDCFDADVESQEAGKIYLDGYYTEVFVIERSHSDLDMVMDSIDVNLTMLSLDPSWISKHKLTISKDASSDDDGIGYPYDYPYDYAVRKGTSTIENPFSRACDFILEIFGPAENPAIIIDGHTYKVNVSLIAGERLIINSSKKTIIKNSSAGSVNCFGDRYKTESVFAQIKSGISSLSYPGTYGFNLTFVCKSSMPYLEPVEVVEYEPYGYSLASSDGFVLVSSDGYTMMTEA